MYWSQVRLHQELQSSVVHSEVQELTQDVQGVRQDSYQAGVVHPDQVDIQDHLDNYSAVEVASVDILVLRPDNYSVQVDIRHQGGSQELPQGQEHHTGAHCRRLADHCQSIHGQGQYIH